MTSLDAFRAQFPIFDRRVYVNSCSQGALSRDVEDAVQQYLTTWREQGSPWEQWVEVCERLRAEFAALIGALPDEVALVPSASSAFGAIATALAYGDRPEVVIGSYEFPTTAHAWLAQQPRGAQVRWVEPLDGDTLTADDYAEAIGARTAIVPVTHVCYRNGCRLDVARIARVCHERGALVCLDDYQSTGTHAADVRALDVDFMVTGALKYLLGPSGIAFLYVRQALIDRLSPLVTGWFGRAQPFAFDATRLDWSPSARRFEGGSPPVVNAYASLAGLRLLRTLEKGDGYIYSAFGRVEAHVGRLTDRLMAGCLERGFRVLTPAEPARRGALVVIETPDASSLVTRLAAHQVIASARGNGLRVSFHAYNSEGDVDSVLAALDAEMTPT